MEKEFVLIGKEPTFILFSKALKSSIPSNFSRLPILNFEKRARALGLKEMVSK